MTLRLIAERVLPKEHGRTYLSRELVHEVVTLTPPRESYDYHLFVSPKNAGALPFSSEISQWLCARVLSQKEVRPAPEASPVGLRASAARMPHPSADGRLAAA